MSDKKRQLVSSLMDRGILVSSEVLDSELDENMLEGLDTAQLVYMNQDVVGLLNDKLYDVNWLELDRFKVKAERENNTDVYKRFLECIRTKDTKQCIEEMADIKYVMNYDSPIFKKDVQDFVMYYNNRFKAIEGILRNRQELAGLTAIARTYSKQDRENIALVGMVVEKSTTANGHIMLTVEDRTGSTKVLVSNNKADAFDVASSLVHDEVIGITGVCGDKIVFATNIILPDIPLNKELKKAPEESYAVFLSDVHLGSTHFLKDKFERFLSWLRGECGTDEHKQIVKKLKYIFIVGDLVAGVGIYPGQEDELEIKDVIEQYDKFAEYLMQIPKHMQVILCPGNHDSLRLSEPQPAFDKTFSAALFDIPNVTLVSNPGIVNVGADENFPGFDVLLYHGYSFDYYISNVDHIRNNGGYDRADLVMKFLLQRRHLAPTHSSTLYVPDKEEDPLVISRIPDFFVSGHIHKSCVAQYRNVSMICGSCWESTTPFQEKVGHKPEPARVPLVNLQSRNTKILRF